MRKNCVTSENQSARRDLLRKLVQEKSKAKQCVKCGANFSTVCRRTHCFSCQPIPGLDVGKEEGSLVEPYHDPSDLPDD